MWKSHGKSAILHRSMAIFRMQFNIVDVSCYHWQEVTLDLSVGNITQWRLGMTLKVISMSGKLYCKYSYGKYSYCQYSYCQYSYYDAPTSRTEERWYNHTWLIVSAHKLNRCDNLPSALLWSLCAVCFKTFYWFFFNFLLFFCFSISAHVNGFTFD